MILGITLTLLLSLLFLQIEIKTQLKMYFINTDAMKTSFKNEVFRLLSQTVEVWANCRNGLVSKKMKVNTLKHKTEAGFGNMLL